MDLGKLQQRVVSFIKKFKFVIIVILVGLVLMLIPDGKTTSQPDSSSAEIIVASEGYNDITEPLAAILSQIDGAGRVEVFLTTAEGEEKIYCLGSLYLVGLVKKWLAGGK